MAREKASTQENQTWTAPVMPDRFKKIETQRFLYSPTKCFGFPVVGWAIGREQMPPLQVGKNQDGSPIMRDWSAIVIRLTQDTKATNREKELVDVKAGQEVIVPATYQLENFLAATAAHPSRVFEVYINPKEEIEIGKGGQSMWDYELGVSPESKTLDEFGLMTKLTGRNVGQLSDGRTYDKTTGEVA
jgi:hypothetical protein